MLLNRTYVYVHQKGSWPSCCFFKHSWRNISEGACRERFSVQNSTILRDMSRGNGNDVQNVPHTRLDPPSPDKKKPGRFRGPAFFGFDSETSQLALAWRSRVSLITSSATFFGHGM